jgi:hypothetical protein
MAVVVVDEVQLIVFVASLHDLYKSQRTALSRE